MPLYNKICVREMEVSIQELMQEGKVRERSRELVFCSYNTVSMVTVFVVSLTPNGTASHCVCVCVCVCVCACVCGCVLFQR